MTQEEREIQSECHRKEIVQILQNRRTFLQGKTLSIDEPYEVSYKIDKPIDKVIEFKKSLLFYFMYLFYIPLVWTIILSTFYPNPKNTVFLAFYMDACFVILILTLTYAIIQDNKVVRKITIYENGIDVDDATIVWADISGIYITSQAWTSKSPIDILWLAMKDGTYQDLNITSYAYSDIGNIIAHYLCVYNPIGEQDIAALKERLTKKSQYFYTCSNGAYTRIN